ncbi:unnamed protein product [Moneuplotes crassus]|uniref:Uncharacterized protein n=1 Tax=Euplotes crassus TaxID=5936 RepID=A0AAD1UEV7_EUPCR|nr:unnamed protein product [Moneuplotes crassus]
MFDTIISQPSTLKLVTSQTRLKKSLAAKHTMLPNLSQRIESSRQGREKPFQQRMAEEPAQSSALRILIEDANRMFRLRQKRKRNLEGSLTLNRKNFLPSKKGQKKAPQFGRQVSLLKKLKILENQDKKKLNNLDRRDNDRAIKILRRKIKEERLRNEYFNKKPEPELRISQNAKTALNHSYDVLFSSYKSPREDESTQKELAALQDTCRPSSTEEDDNYDSLNACKRIHNVGITFDETDQTYSQKVSGSPEERKMVKNVLFLENKFEDERAKLELTCKAIQENSSMNKNSTLRAPRSISNFITPEEGYQGSTDSMKLRRRKFHGVRIHPPGKIQIEAKKTLRLRNPMVAKVEDLDTTMDRRKLQNRKHMASRIQAHIQEGQAHFERKISLAPKFWK